VQMEVVRDRVRCSLSARNARCEGFGWCLVVKIDYKAPAKLYFRASLRVSSFDKDLAVILTSGP
jgi:hypothetical protein